MNPEEVGEVKGSEVHRFIVQKLNAYYEGGMLFYPFSIKNGNNIYGVVFGASHRKAVDKFLSLAWKLNDVNGEADYDIDEDVSIQPSLFGDTKMTKIQKFGHTLSEEILSGRIRNNVEAYDFCLLNGHIAKHGRDVVDELKKEGKIYYKDARNCISYDSVIKKKKVVEFEVK